MRLHQTLGAATGALLMVLTLPTTAQAAQGEFLYRTSTHREAGIHNPESGTCINLPGTGENTPGHSPKNHTNATATLFLEADCSGDTYFVVEPGHSLNRRAKFRSIVFS
ncbi:hypothetical protein [Streptomyces sp. NPDC029003]|uniref:hypothetical protein n=1 Tax=Streptomyces sp. NPDC029003 TaxID=3155125 RepID=UPI0033D89714